MERFINPILNKAGLLAGTFMEVILRYHHLLITQFGQTITLVIYLCLFLLTLVIAIKIIRLAAALLIFVIVPSFILGFILTWILPLDFPMAQPVSGAAVSLLFLVKT